VERETAMSKLRFGAGIWHFATYVDRYATDGYGTPRSVIEAIAQPAISATIASMVSRCQPANPLCDMRLTLR